MGEVHEIPSLSRQLIAVWWCDVTTSKELPNIWVGQVLHAACLVPLLALVWAVWVKLDRPFAVAFWIAIALPVVHQVFVWLAWRLELGSSAISQTIGFRTYLVLFFLLLSGRVVSVLALAWIDRGSLNIPILPRASATAVLGLLWLYTAYSVERYFGFVRAAGADHFDPSYREMPLVRDGIFRFMNNGMYVFGFLVLWALAVGFNSVAALLATVFSHAYVWVHFYATEKPDMDYLYSSAGTPA